MFISPSLIEQTLSGWSGPRRILFLQGNSSPFWAELGATLRDRGVEVHKIHFCLADRVFWRGGGDHVFEGTLEQWPEYLETYLRDQQITDVIYYADQLPYHRAAHEVCSKLGLPTWAVELGYLRPDWITLEAGGTGAHSVFASDRVDLPLRAAVGHDPKTDVKYRHPFWQEAFYEVAFGLLISAGRPIHRNYVSDRLFWPICDYLSWVPKLLASPLRSQQARRAQKRLLAHKGGYSLVAMQIESDYQIRRSSRYGGLMEFLDEVMASFARAAPADQKLAVKLHPMDSGLEAWVYKARALARKHGILHRVEIFRGGDLGALLAQAQGVVTVNSTVGVHALRVQKPVYTAGTAVYDKPGLTHQGGLDQFWSTPEPVNTRALDQFLRALTTIQLRGSFYDRAGRQDAATEIADRLMSANWRSLSEFDEAVAPERQRQPAQKEQPQAQGNRVANLHVSRVVERVDRGSGLADDMQDGVVPERLCQRAG